MTKFAIRYPGGTLVVIWMALIVTMWMMPDLRPDPIGVLPKSCLDATCVSSFLPRGRPVYLIIFEACEAPLGHR